MVARFYEVLFTLGAWLVAATVPLAGQSATDQEAVQLTSSDGVTVYGDYHSGEGADRPLILLFHQGGANVRAEYANITPRLLEHGFDVLAFDLRAGGDRFGGSNRTVDGLDGREYSYCDAYADVELVAGYAMGRFPRRPLIAWGSSFSAALVVRLAAESPSQLVGALAFSPASGEPMGECSANEYLEQVSLPLFVLRPESEAAIESVAAQLRASEAAGHRTYVSRPGAHGSSMLDPSRVDGGSEATWERVLAFLAEARSR